MYECDELLTALEGIESDLRAKQARAVRELARCREEARRATNAGRHDLAAARSLDAVEHASFLAAYDHFAGQLMDVLLRYSDGPPPARDAARQDRILSSAKGA